MAGGPPSQGFHFEDAGSGTLKAWARYKLKECWSLVQCLMQLRGLDGGVIVHNWWGGTPEKFTREFRARRAAGVDSALAEAPIVLAHNLGKPARLFALGLAAFLALLPVGWIVALTRALLPRGLGPLLVYCDGHLSGFALVLAVRGRGGMTYTLHHGLYRSDDRGSVMGIRNFVADRICLWDGCTEQTFLAAGLPPKRLLRVGEYGFGALPMDDGPLDEGWALLCPPYDHRQIALFRQLEAALPEAVKTFWSLHPMLREDHKDLKQVTVASVTPRPIVAICGDSGALMDALARSIPVITVSDRRLAATHLTLAEVAEITPDRLAGLVKQAKELLQDDRGLFGFEDAVLHSECEVV